MTETPLGLSRGVVRLAGPDPRWPAFFETISSDLHALLGGNALSVHHVGSTAVRGIPAKPILDLLVLIPDFRQARGAIATLETAGWEFRPGEDIPDRHYLRRPAGGAVVTHHLSLAETDSHHARATLAFRDALRADPPLAQEYAALKRDLARRFPADRAAYLEGKTAFVERVLTGAGVEPGRSG